MGSIFKPCYIQNHVITNSVIKRFVCIIINWLWCNEKETHFNHTILMPVLFPFMYLYCDRFFSFLGPFADIFFTSAFPMSLPWICGGRICLKICNPITGSLVPLSPLDRSEGWMLSLGRSSIPFSGGRAFWNLLMSMVQEKIKYSNRITSTHTIDRVFICLHLCFIIECRETVD